MKNIKLSDYVASYLVKNKLKYIFSVTGAGSMHFNDAIGTKKGLKVIYTHHEQSASMAAEGVGYYLLVKQLLPLQIFLSELGFKQDKPSLIYGQ